MDYYHYHHHYYHHEQESLDNLEVHSERLQRQAKEEVVELQEDLRQMTDRASESALREAQATTQAHMAAAALARATDRMAVLDTELEAVKEHMNQRLAAEQKASQEEIDQLRQRITENIQESSGKISKLTEDLSHLRNQLAEAESEIATLKIKMQQR
jgi:chromosome segregation ATPase